MTLCSLCQAISLDQMRGPNMDRMQRHQPNYLALKRSADGCRLCQFFWMALEQGGSYGVKSNRPAMSHVSERYPGREILLCAWGGAGDILDRIHIITTGSVASSAASTASGEDDVADPTMHPDHQIALDGVVDLYAYPDDPAAWHGGVGGRPLPRTAGSHEDWELATRWMQDCLNNHEACPKAAETSLPTRVIDVGPSDGSMQPYLFISGGTKGRYLTLSHCWGGKVCLTTTSSTLEERKRSIPLTSLPKTFREAVITTRMFDIRYLWIDSLCILQDSRLDWEKESAVMGDTYAAGYLNIAARGAPNAEVGLFIPRQAEPPPCRLEYRSLDGSIAGSMYVRSPAFPTETLRDTPLDKRGWVLQERLLSPRVLYFGAQQIYWECAETTLRQDGKHHDAAKDALRIDQFKTSLDFNAAVPKVHGQGQAQAARYRQWYSVVTEFTRRSLTFESDKLPAISGIAKAFQARTGCTYIAGVWLEDLPERLLWYKRAPSEPISQTLPSWSWARLKGIVNFRNDLSSHVDDHGCCCKVIDVTYQNTGHNPYGDVVGVQLRLQGQLIQVIHSKQTADDLKSSWLPTVRTLDGRAVGNISFDIASPNDKRVFFCLLVSNKEYASAALALEPLQERPEVYIRVGYVSVDFDVGLDGRTPFWESGPKLSQLYNQSMVPY